MDLALLFLSAFGAATVLPMSSEAVLAALAASRSSDTWQLLAVATAGNTLGAVVNWGIGRCALHYQGRPWFPVDAGRLERASCWFARWGVWSLLLSWTPILGDALTVAAGLLRVGLAPFIILVAAGKALRYAVVLFLVDTAAAML